MTAVNASASWPLLEVAGLRTEFNTPRGVLTAVNGVSFRVDRGETVGIVGESGSGKSMTARSILRIVPSPGRIAGGKVFLNGRNLLELSEGEMTRVRGGGIAMIFQEPGAALNPVLTVGEQITEAIELHQRKRGREALGLAVDYLARVGIPAPELRMRSYPYELSGGMQQRATIAMALACTPELLIADEPTTALDVTIQAQILELLVTLARERGLGLIFITHNIAAVAQIARRVIVMYAGRIVEEGATDQIIDAPRHPYTEALLQAMPTMRSARGARLWEIPGQVADLLALPPGCPFNPRCGRSFARCTTEAPELRETPPAGRVACWLFGGS